jgi:single-strand DNA-binding protein
MFNATVTGNLGRDPEFRTTQTGQMVSKFSLAIRQAKKDAPAFWVKVEVWGKQAEYVANYLKKGASVCVTGQVEEEQWSDKATGELKKALVVKNASVESWQARSEQATPAPAPARQAAAPASYEPIDDEVPF